VTTPGSEEPGFPSGPAGQAASIAAPPQGSFEPILTHTERCACDSLKGDPVGMIFGLSIRL